MADHPKRKNDVRKSNPAKLPSSGVAVGVGLIVKPLLTPAKGRQIVKDIYVLLQKRGKKVPHPFEWSLPGGLMDEKNDSHDNYLTGVTREVAETTGAGLPPGLPPFQPITYSMHPSGRTVTHILGLRPGTKYDNWAPAATRKYRQEVDTKYLELEVNGKNYVGHQGYVWVTWADLVSESSKPDDERNKALHPALTAWFKSNGSYMYRRVSSFFVPCQYWPVGRCVRPDCWFWHVGPGPETAAEGRETLVSSSNEGKGDSDSKGDTGNSAGSTATTTTSSTADAAIPAKGVETSPSMKSISSVSTTSTQASPALSADSTASQPEWEEFQRSLAETAQALAETELEIQQLGSSSTSR